MIWFIFGVLIGICIMCCIQVNHDNDDLNIWINMYHKLHGDYKSLLKKYETALCRIDKLERGDSNAEKRD